MPNKDWSRRRILAGGAVALALPLAAHAQEVASVSIDHHDFSPKELTVKPGTKVVWRNADATPHNVVSTETPRVFRSRILNTGESYEFTFAAPGRYGYFCALHPQMVGVVIVA
jgi:plastocyanin